MSDLSRETEGQPERNTDIVTSEPSGDHYTLAGAEIITSASVLPEVFTSDSEINTSMSGSVNSKASSSSPFSGLVFSWTPFIPHNSLPLEPAMAEQSFNFQRQPLNAPIDSAQHILGQCSSLYVPPSFVILIICMCRELRVALHNSLFQVAVKFSLSPPKLASPMFLPKTNSVLIPPLTEKG